MHRSAILLGIVAATLAAAPAQACRVFLSPKQRIASGYKEQIFTGVALVRIERARHVQERYGDTHPWEASATVQRALSGRYRARTVTIDGGWGSSRCDIGAPMPKTGDLWIVYYWTKPDGTQDTHQAYPLKMAAAADPRVAAAVR